MQQEQWFKIRSWHKIKSTSFFTSRANIDFTVVKAYCGQKRDFRVEEFDSRVRSTFEIVEKTCETCLRLGAR